MKQSIQLDSIKRKFKIKADRIIIFILYAVLLLALLNQNIFSGTEINRYNEAHGYTEPFWSLTKDGELIDPALQLPAFMKLEGGEHYFMSAALSYDGSRESVPACFFFVDHIFCRVFLDGEQLFSYMPEDVQKPDGSKSPGNVYVSFLMPRDSVGRELSIELIPALDLSIDYQLPCPTFGDYSSTAVHTFKADLSHNLVVILSACIGVISVLFSTLALPGPQYREGLFIGIFATLFSLYGLTESDFDFYVISNPYYTYALDYFTFSLTPLFLIAFIRERLDSKQKKVCLVMLVTGGIMCFAELVLHVCGILDAREFLPVIHLVYGIDILIIFSMLIIFKKDSRKKQLILQLIPILTGMVLDVCVYYMHWQLDTSDATFASIGVIIFLLTELYHVWKYSIEMYTDAAWSETYREMALADALTGVGNRRAYELERNAIIADQRKFRELIAASVDVNELKYNNDTFGHAAGDFLIRSAAEVLAVLAQDYGYVFRMGGDEFIVLIYDMTQDEFEKRLKQMQRQTDAINSNSEIKLSLSIGFDMSSVNDIDSVIENADRQMYIDKARFKDRQPRS